MEAGHGGRPKHTQWRDHQKDTEKLGYTWPQIKVMAQDRALWRTSVDCLYPKRGVRHKQVSLAVGQISSHLILGYFGIQRSSRLTQ